MASGLRRWVEWVEGSGEEGGGRSVLSGEESGN